jgi:hypothetical protein
MLPLHSKSNRTQTIFIFGAAMILCVTGIAKLLSAFFANEILLNQDHVLFPMTNKSVYFWVGICEFIGTVYLLNEKSMAPRFFFLVSLGTLFGAYRAGLFWIGEKSCGCLGSMADWMSLPEWAVNASMNLAVAYLTLGGAYFLLKEKYKFPKPGSIAADSSEDASSDTI